MLHKYISNLIQSIPKERLQLPEKMNVIIEGGLFNGSYAIGVLYYLKLLESMTTNKVKIRKLSGCSIGSVVILLYFIENNAHLEDIVEKIYKLGFTKLKESTNVNIFDDLFEELKAIMPTNLLDLVQDRVYITYFNALTNKRIVRKTYKSVDDLFDCVRKSCSFPYIIDNKFLYKGKYVDGFYPHIFGRKNQTKNFYVNLHSFDKLFYMVNVRNETTNIHRVYEGVIKTHLFIAKGHNNELCSYVENWNIIDKGKYYVFIFVLHIFQFAFHNLTIVWEKFFKGRSSLSSFRKILKILYRDFVSLYLL